jgi:SpoVK/Ycf46/Vps4 family AAA+-type ATPase
VQHDLVILPLVRPELFARGKLLTPTKGVLLYGPPGTGKTMIAKALAKESGACFLNVRSAALQSKWFGDAQKLVTAVFTLAWKIQPCVIFIDEIDSFLGSRKSSEHEAVTSMKTEFMALWDGFLTDNNARVLVLAATNRPWDIDEAILRRLPRAFEVPLPDAAQRKRILSVLLRGEDVDDTLWADRDGDLERLAQATGGFSGSDLQDLCKQAAILPIHDLLEEERAAGALDSGLVREPRPLTAEDLFAVLEVRQHLSLPFHGFTTLTPSLLSHAELRPSLRRGCCRIPPLRHGGALHALRDPHGWGAARRARAPRARGDAHPSVAGLRHGPGGTDAGHTGHVTGRRGGARHQRRRVRASCRGGGRGGWAPPARPAATCFRGRQRRGCCCCGWCWW